MPIEKIDSTPSPEEASLPQWQQVIEQASTDDEGVSQIKRHLPNTNEHVLIIGHTTGEFAGKYNIIAGTTYGIEHEDTLVSAEMITANLCAWDIPDSDWEDWIVPKVRSDR